MSNLNVSPKNYLKNLPPTGTFQTFGNTGVFFPYKDCEIPQFVQSCFLCIEENREVTISTEEGQTLLIDCPLGF
jgi:hypothetical protein